MVMGGMRSETGRLRRASGGGWERICGMGGTLSGSFPIELKRRMCGKAMLSAGFGAMIAAVDWIGCGETSADEG